MQMAPYLSFNGQCEAAFTFYAQTLGGAVGELFRYGGSPMAGEVPADWHDKVMHGSVVVNGQTLMGADTAAPQYEKPQGFSISIHLKDTAEAERLFAELSREGLVQMPLQETFWAARFGACVDRFGTPWTINCEAS